MRKQLTLAWFLLLALPSCRSHLQCNMCPAGKYYPMGVSRIMCSYMESDNSFLKVRLNYGQVEASGWGSCSRDKEILSDTELTNVMRCPGYSGGWCQIGCQKLMSVLSPCISCNSSTYSDAGNLFEYIGLLSEYSSECWFSIAYNLEVQTRTDVRVFKRHPTHQDINRACQCAVCHKGQGAMREAARRGLWANNGCGPAGASSCSRCPPGTYATEPGAERVCASVHVCMCRTAFTGSVRP